MKIEKHVLKNTNGLSIEFINFGGIVTSLKVPDRDGILGDIVLGFDDPLQYQRQNPFYFGALIGRYANRIARGQFILNGRPFTLAINNGPNALHGGDRGFDKVFWSVEAIEVGKSARLSLISADGDEGYPGTLKIEVIYSLNDAGEFTIDYRATTDQATVVNLTHHSYFNLSGRPGTTILDHELMIDADAYTVADANLIPTGEIRTVSEELDFRKPRRVGERIDRLPQGYDLNYVLNPHDQSKVIATVWHPPSGRVMDVMTTEPGLQFYSAYSLDGSVRGKGDVADPRFGGLCLEAQRFPDSPNQPSFPSTVLEPSEIYRQVTTYRFSVKP